jgi:large subunit ribosomal protein L21
MRRGWAQFTYFNYPQKFNIAYAIVKVNGQQLWVEEKRFYDLNKLPLHPGDTFHLSQVLLRKQGYSIEIGTPFLNHRRVSGQVVRDTYSLKNRVYKMRPKKKTRKTSGGKPKLTRVYIMNIALHHQYPRLLRRETFVSRKNQDER